MDPFTPSLTRPLEEYWERHANPVLNQMTAVQKWMVLWAVILAASVEVGMRFGVNILLVDMEGNVAASQDDISWVVTVYGAGFIFGLATSAGLVRYLGPRNHFGLMLALFGAGTLGCFVSHELWQLLTARAIQGLAGGTFIVRGQVLIYTMFQGRERAARSLMFGVVIQTFRALMPVGMAAVTDASSWNYAFLLALPFILLAGGMICIFLPQHGGSPEHEPNAPSLLLLLAGLSSLQIGLSRGERNLWFESPFIVLMFLTAVLCVVLWTWWDSRPYNLEPILHLRWLVSQPTLTASFLEALVVGAALATGLYVLPQYLRSVQTYSATQTGLFFLVDALATGLALVVATKFLMAKVGPRGVLAAGFLFFSLAALGFVYGLTLTTPGQPLALLLVVHGLGLGWLVAGLTNLAMTGVEPAYVSEADTWFRLVRQIGANLGVTAAAVLLDWRQTLHSSRLLDVANRLDPKTHAAVNHYAEIVAQRAGPESAPVAGGYQLFKNAIIQQARLLAYVDICWCLAVLGLVGLVVALVKRQYLTASVTEVRPLPRTLPGPGVPAQAIVPRRVTTE
jgi:DHA2 family multidrug resistance protein